MEEIVVVHVQVNGKPVNSDSWCVTTCTSSGTPSTDCYENGDTSKPNKKNDNKYCYCTSA